MQKSTQKTVIRLNKMVGKVQKSPAPARTTNPMGARKHRVLELKKGEWFVAPIKEQKLWSAAGSHYARGRTSCYLHPESTAFCIFEIIK